MYGFYKLTSLDLEYIYKEVMKVGIVYLKISSLCKASLCYRFLEKKDKYLLTAQISCARFDIEIV